MADAPLPPPRVPRALMWLAVVTAAYTAVRLLDPPPPSAPGQGEYSEDTRSSSDQDSSDDSGDALPLPVGSIVDAGDDPVYYPYARSFEDVEWFWAVPQPARALLGRRVCLDPAGEGPSR